MGLPKILNGNLKFNNNKVKTLQDCSEEIYGTFNCSHNLLRDLLGGPKIVTGGYDCSWNLIRSLKGIPKIGGLEKEKEVNCSVNNIIILDDYDQGCEFKYVQMNPIIINRLDALHDDTKWGKTRIDQFKDAFPFIIDDIKNKEEFLAILVKMISIDIIMEFPKEIVELSKKFNINLSKYFHTNIVRVLKSKTNAKNNTDIGFIF